MSARNRNLSTIILVAVIALSASACAPSPGTALPSTLTPTRVPTDTVTPLPPTIAPTKPIPATATPIPIPAITLKKGDFYFSVEGAPSIIFSRNMAGYQPSQYERLLDLTRSGDSKLVRIQLDSMGAGYTKNGAMDETWATNWEQVLDYAAADGIQVIPVFAGWFDWNNGNPDYGYSTWESNPFNSANGGPATTPAVLFQPDSPTQKLWLQWMKTVVERWQGRNNIAAWEIFSEVNISSGATESVGVDFANKAASIIRAADSRHRPTTASLAEVGEWPSFYRSDAIDFINFHPYPSSGQLDTFIIQYVRQYMVKYNKPVLIGESGLSALAPDSSTLTLTTAKNAQIGIKHAIWAAMVSGAMNGRALYWEDSFAIFFPYLSWPFVEKYADAELPAARFANGVNFAGFKPLTAQFSEKITGAAVGNEKSVIGWFRDANCEPPDWNLQPVISKQKVTLAVPGSASNWKVDFYNTKTGTDIINSITASRQGNQIAVALPDFSDDIAFKMYIQPGAQLTPSTAIPLTDTPAPTAVPAPTATDLIAGKWTGTLFSETDSFSTRIDLSIRPACKAGSVCGTVSAAQCTGDLALEEIGGDTFVFVEQKMTGASTCVSGGNEYLSLQADGTLLFRYKLTTAQGTIISSNGILKRP